jgi:hypothetical protein
MNIVNLTRFWGKIRVFKINALIGKKPGNGGELCQYLVLYGINRVGKCNRGRDV